MRYILPILFIFLYSCQTQIKYPDGGFDYPKNVSGRDTNIYFYQLKDSFPKGKEFFAFNEFFFYQPFDEPNLSIKPLEKETFRFTCSPSFDKTIIINIDEDHVTIKEGDENFMYEEDTAILSRTDSLLTQTLRMFYPIDTANIKDTSKKNYLISLVKLYPQLLDHSYYTKFFEKIPVRNKKFRYETTRQSITRNQFVTLVKQINDSGYWALPNQIKCEELVLDGSGFTLEANTSKKYKSVSAGSCGSDKTGFLRICRKIMEFAKIR